MKGSLLFTNLLVSLLLLSSCAAQHNSPTALATNFIQRQKIIATTPESYPSKQAKAISLYTKDKNPHKAYKIIGVASVSKFNLLGIKRREDTLTDMIKKLAASIGGDGLIDIQHNDNQIKANVIAYQKILL
jgi:hypothetical protein